MDRCIIIISEGFHQVVSCQELIGRENAVRLLTRDTHELRKACAGTDKYCLKALFIHQLVDGNGLADDHVSLNLNAQLLHVLNLRADNGLFRETELRDTVG